MFKLVWLMRIIAIIHSISKFAALFVSRRVEFENNTFFIYLNFIFHLQMYTLDTSNEIVVIMILV